VIKDAAIVTIRNSSTRLPNKAIMEIKDSARSVDVVVERAKRTKFPVIIATSTDQSDEIFIDVARSHDVNIFRGALLNKIKRWHDCFLEFGVENALMVDGDDLAYDYDIGLRAMEELKSSNFDMISSPPDIVPGFFTYAISKEGINKMYNVVSDEQTNTDVITKFIEKANLSNSYVSLRDYERNRKVRLTLDYEEDLLFFRTLYKDLDLLANGKTIIDFLDKNPTVSQINLHRQNDFLKNQMKFNEGIK